MAPPILASMRDLVGDRLGSILGRAARGGGGGDPLAGLPGDAPAGAGGQRSAGLPLEFLAYGDDCLLVGRVRLVAARLTDFLNEHTEYELDDLVIEQLSDGRSAATSHFIVPRDEILLVQLVGPRGDQIRRVRTQPHPVAAKVGEYRVRGRLHAPPGLDPTTLIGRRPTMVPLTDAVVERPIGEDRELHPIGTVALNRTWLDWIVETWDDSSRWLEGDAD